MKNFIFFEKVLYTTALDKSFYKYCLLRQPVLVKYLLIRIAYGFLFTFGICPEEKYYNVRWYFLKNVKNLEAKVNLFWSSRFRRLYKVLDNKINLWISKYPDLLLLTLAEQDGVELYANSFDLIEGRFSSFSSYEELYRTAARSVKPALIADTPNKTVNTGVETIYAYRGNSFKSRSACRRFVVLHYIFTFATLLCMGIGLGIVSMYFASIPIKRDIFNSYFDIPIIPLLNTLPIVLFIFLTYFIFNHVWLSFAITSIITLSMTLINYFKLMLRNDPLLASDISLFFEANTIVKQYTLDFNWKIIAIIIFCIVVTILSSLIVRGRIHSGRVRTAGIVLVISATLFSYFNFYTSEAVYKQTENLKYISQWSATQQYASRGFFYPFLYSVQSAYIKPPEGYNEKYAAELLSAYGYDDIPEGKKINVVMIMLEAFNDFTKFGKLNFTEDLYKPFHDLQKRSYSGELITNIFSGGTTDTEWSVLTGFSTLNEFRKNVNSYVRYFREQGYYAEGSHPCYNWFYNRKNVNEYLGFNNYYFYEEKYYELSGGIAPDRILFPEITRLYEEHLENSNEPYFSFNVTYQNHGPYDPDNANFDKEYVNAKNGCSSESYNILNNYFKGIADTVQNVADMADYFAEREEPVVFVVFGDHNPWLGAGRSTYYELGITFDFANEGFLEYYSVPYLIFANDAAKTVLDNDFIGSGKNMGPCFLMNELFGLCGFGGNEFMKLTNEVYQTTPLVHKTGMYIFDGELTNTPPESAMELLDKYAKLQYYWRWNFKSQ